MTSTQSSEVGVRHPDLFYIGGKWVEPSSASMFDVVDSATEEPFLRVAAAQEADMRAAVAAARSAFDSGPWPQLSPADRAGYMNAIAAKIRDRSSDIARIWTRQMGMLYARTLPFAAGLGGVYEYYAGFAESFTFVERHQPTAGGDVGLLVREPVGVVGAIVPWNGPLPLILYKTGPALIAGCTVVLKASPEAPGEAYILAEIAEEVGLPPGVINVVTADREVSELLVRDPRVDKISFTGSTAAGRRIASLMGERIGRYTLELGGKSAAVILDDYDVDTAAKSISTQAVNMTGQACCALTRVIVSRAQHDNFVEALATSFSGVRVGNPFDINVSMGPLVSQRQLDKVLGYVHRGQADGAVLVTGGGRPPALEAGFFVEPTVFARVDNSTAIAQEEIFGPVISVISADSEQQAIDLANDSIYGLNASVYTNDTDRALSVARHLRSGTVGHNEFRRDFGIAFGGFKQSGIGREGGREGILPYLETKTIILDGETGS
jgi:aldehyde dehydrogenase (NAD+)